MGYMNYTKYFELFLRLRHSRPVRGLGALDPHRDFQSRQVAAAGHAEGCLRAAGKQVRGGISGRCEFPVAVSRQSNGGWRGGAIRRASDADFSAGSVCQRTFRHPARTYGDVRAGAARGQYAEGRDWRHHLSRCRNALWPEDAGGHRSRFANADAGGEKRLPAGTAGLGRLARQPGFLSVSALNVPERA